MLTLKSSAAGSARRTAGVFRTTLTLFVIVGLPIAALGQELRAMKPAATKAAVIEDKGDEKTTSAKAESKDYIEMLKMVEALEERVRQLEAKLAKVEAAKTTDTATTDDVKTAIKAEEIGRASCREREEDRVRED